MRGPELTVPYADLPPGLDELAVGRELADARRGAALEPFRHGGRGRHALSVVPVGHVDAAVRPDDDVVRLIELAVGVARLARAAEAQKLLALRAELVDLVPLGPGRIAAEIRNPDVALSIDGDAMRRDHHTLAEVRQDCAGVTVEFEDRIDDVGIAGGTTAAGARSRADAAALVRPDISVDRIDVDPSRRAPRPPRWQLPPVPGHFRCRVRQPLACDRVRHFRGALRRQCGRAVSRIV